MECFANCHLAEYAYTAELRNQHFLKQDALKTIYPVHEAFWHNLMAQPFRGMEAHLRPLR